MRSILCTFLLMLIGVGCSQDQQKRGTGEAGPTLQQAPRSPLTIPRFDGTAAFSCLLRQVQFGPRNPNSEGHRACAQYLTGLLGAYADTVRLQEFTHNGYKNEVLSLTNIIGSFNPAAKSRILLCAHWDTRPRAEHDENKARRNEPILGANDGASGVAVLLHLASLFKTTRPAVGVDVVFFDGEDYGMEGDHQRYFLGSRYFATAKDPDYAPQFGILLDMVGDTYLELPREGYSVRFAPDVVDLVWNTARDLGISQFVADVGPEIIDDHLPLNEGGLKTIDLIDFNYPDPTNRFWHTHQDTPEHCSPLSLEAVGTVLTHVIYTQKP